MAAGSVLLLIVAVRHAIAASHCENDGGSLLQVNSLSDSLGQNLQTFWQNPRDVAIVPRPYLFPLNEQVDLQVFSTVPSFGRDGNFIAILLEPVLDSQDHTASNKLDDFLEHNQIFCTGPDRSHRVQLRLSPARTNLLCDWPADEARETHFQVFLENAEGKLLGQFNTSHQPVLQQYDTVACVRDIFVDEDPNHVSEIFSGPFKQLVQWLEFYKLHGVDHFLFYTFHGTEDAAEEVLTPYLRDGVASRVHFNHYPEVTLMRQHYVVRDCLYRMKSRAKWLLTAVDVDEYVHFRPNLFPGHTVPQDFLRSAWHLLVQRSQRKNIQSIKLDRCNSRRGNKA